MTGTREDLPSRRLRVLNLCETARGGVGVYQNLMLGLHDAGFDLHVVAPRQHAAILSPDLDVIAFENPRRGVAGVWRLIRCFARTRRRLDPDICFFHSTFALAALAWMRLTGDRRPAVYCAHGWAISNYDRKSLKGRIVRAIEGRLCGLADVVVNVSQYERDLARELGYRGRHVVIENGVPPARPDARDDLFAAEAEALHLLFVGRLDRQKGFDLLAQAVARVARTDLRVHVVGEAVRGDGTQVAPVSGIETVGWVGPDRIDDWYRSADALVVPSRWEAFGLVIPEALRNGTPVLCARRGAMPGLVEDGVTGQHFDLEVGAISDILEQLDKGRLRAMRPSCTRVFETRFTSARMNDQLAALLRGLGGNA